MQTADSGNYTGRLFLMVELRAASCAPVRCGVTREITSSAGRVAKLSGRLRLLASDQNS